MDIEKAKGVFPWLFLLVGKGLFIVWKIFIELFEGTEMADSHQSHKQVPDRLKRAHGHMHKIMDMMVEGRPCVEVAQQLYAVEKAVVKAKRLLIHDHIDHCLGQDEAEDAQAIGELEEITKYL